MTKFYLTAIIAHIDHGKTTIVDSLLAHIGHISKFLAGEIRCMDSRDDEQNRGITMKNSCIKVNNHYFIDTPGHSDFESLISSAAALVDNFLLLIDVNEGITPRTFALIKFIDRKRTVLVLNKIDKCNQFGQIELVLSQVNAFLGEEIFQWGKNNIIISSAIICSGTNYENFNISTKNTLKMAFKSFKVLEEKIKIKDLEKIKEKYKIRSNDRKHIFNGVFPLEKAIFSTIEGLNGEPERQKGIFKDESDCYKIKNDLIEIIFDDLPKNCILSTSAKFMNNNLIKDDLLFLCRILKGSVEKNSSLILSNTDKKVLIQKIYDFKGDELIEIDGANEGMIVYLKADLDKNCLISETACVIKFESLINPSYNAKIVLEDLSLKAKAIHCFKMLSFVENGLKVRKNRYNEFEIKCLGKMQFEKICYDLMVQNIKYKLGNYKKQFKEFPQKKIVKYFNVNQNEGKVSISQIKQSTNIIEISDNYKNHGLITSVISLFLTVGPLIKEPIFHCKITVETEGTDVELEYNTLRSILSRAYAETSPSITPLYYQITVMISSQYLGTVYNILQGSFYEMDDEEFDTDLEFFIIKCKIPQFILNKTVEEIRKESKGTAYLNIKEAGFVLLKSFNDMLKAVQKEKGIYIEEKIVENPEKQRTLKK
ncbi:Eftud1 [Nucleospora cyclopteri]